ncbi:MAG: FISUMP domain-containing protein [Saprospiraceae bacterium]
MGKSLLMLIMLLAIGGKNSNSIIINDERDGNQYETVQIGNLTIMAENLNYDIDGSICFRESEDFCSKYGRLYDYKTAMKGSEEEYAQGICPNGWHIPSAEEWTYLIQNIQEGKLIYKENSPASRILPNNPLKLKFAGNKSASNDKVYLVGRKGAYMTSSTKDGKWMVVNFSRKSNIHELSLESKHELKAGVSCRCVMD